MNGVIYYGIQSIYYVLKSIDYRLFEQNRLSKQQNDILITQTCYNLDNSSPIYYKCIREGWINSSDYTSNFKSISIAVNTHRDLKNV